MSIYFSCCCAVWQSGAGLASYSASSFGKRINANGFFSLCCSGKLNVLVKRHQPCMILGILIFKLCRFKRRHLWKLFGLQSSLLWRGYNFVPLCIVLQLIFEPGREDFLWIIIFFFFSLKRRSSAGQEGLQKTELINLHWFHQPFIILMGLSYLLFLTFS